MDRDIDARPFTFSQVFIRSAFRYKTTVNYTITRNGMIRCTLSGMDRPCDRFNIIVDDCYVLVDPVNWLITNRGLRYGSRYSGRWVSPR